MLDLHKRFTATVATAFLVVTNSGCSLLDPYVRAKMLDSADIDAVGIPASELPQNKALTSAFKAAATQRAAYYDAVSDRAKLRNGLPLFLIPLSAVALYKGLSSDGGESTRKVLLKEGLVGASVFAIGSYYTSTNREQIYLAGAKALSCSIYALTPYYLPDDLAASISTANIAELNRALVEVTATTAQVRSYQQSAGAADTNLRTKLAELIARAELSIEAARQVRNRASQTQARLDDAGARLRVTVENVVVAVNEQIARMEPDPSVILTLAGSLPTTAKQLAPGGTFTAASAGPAKPVDVSVSEQTAPINALPKQVAALDARVASVQFALDVIDQRVKTTPPPETCQVQSTQGRLDIWPEDAVEMKVGDRFQFVIRTTAGIPTIAWVGPVSPEVTLTQSVSGSSMLATVEYKAAVEGLSQVALQVSTGELRKQVTITLLPNSPPAAKTKEEKRPIAENPRPKAGAPGGKPGAGRPGGIGGAQAGPKNAFERDLRSDKIRALQEKLKVPPTGAFDPATRIAIEKWRREHELRPFLDQVRNTLEYDTIMK